MKTNQKITLKVQTRNLNGTKLKLTILQNRFSKGIVEHSVSDQAMVENETAEWDLDTGSWRDWSPDPKKISFYQVKITEANGDNFYYPKEKARLKDNKIDWQKLISYQSLKLCDNTVMEELAKTNAPLKIGEPLEVEQTHENGKCPRCEEEITLKQIENVFGVLSTHKSFRQEIIDNLNKYIFDSDKEIHINTCLRKAHFFAQVGSETLGINPDWMVETDVYRYSKSRCLEVFGNRAKNLNAKNLLDDYCNNKPQKRLLNYMYAKGNGFDNGNGDEASGDGYLFRGRGLKQLTGRENYRNATNYIKEIFPNEYINLETNPNKVSEAKYAVLSAIAYWEKHKIWQLADTLTVSKDDSIKKIRRKVNPGLAGWKDAKRYFEKGIEIFKVNSCSPTKVENKNTGKWHEPVDNPCITIYTQGGNKRPWRSSFGEVRPDIGRGHHGLDLYVEKGSNIYACMDGVVVYTGTVSGYGKVVIIKISSTKDFNERRLSYTPYYIKSKRNYNASEYDISGFGDFTEKEGISSSTDVYLKYAHLDKILVNTSDKKEVKSGSIIAESGVTGVSGGTCGPHLHFEISSKQWPSGFSDRYNPAYYVQYKNETQLSDTERKEQDDIKDLGKTT